MRIFIPRYIFCNDGDFIFRFEEKESGLETRYACSKMPKRVNTFVFGGTGRRLKMVENYPRTTMCLDFGRRLGMYGMSGIIGLQDYGACKIQSNR